jgi:uncharacterized OsmC-like protein
MRSRRRAMAVVSVKSVSRMTHVVTSGKHTITADEPASVGDDLGMTPYELLLASLGS